MGRAKVHTNCELAAARATERAATCGELNVIRFEVCALIVCRNIHAVPLAGSVQERVPWNARLGLCPCLRVGKREKEVRGAICMVVVRKE